MRYMQEDATTGVTVWRAGLDAHEIRRAAASSGTARAAGNPSPSRARPGPGYS